MGVLETRLRADRDRGEKIFAPYVTGGFPGVDAALLRALAATGADAIEGGTHPRDVLATIAEAGLDVPIAVMTYANIVTHPGLETFCDDAAAAGVAGLIVPDLPVDEAAELEALAATRGIDVVLLAAPGTTSERYAEIGAASRGFVYCVATYGVTGARESLAATAQEVVAAMRPTTDLP